MNRFFVFLGLIFLFSCTMQTDNLQVANEFYKASNEYSFEKIAKLTADTVTIKDGNYEMNYSKEEYFDLFQWDSVFKPIYHIEYIEEINSEVFVKISTTSHRFAFLANNPLTTTHRISFKNNKIRKIELYEYVETDFNIWVQKRDSLVNFVDSLHPDLNGFIYDMSKIGAENYMKAIELYRNK